MTKPVQWLHDALDDLRRQLRHIARDDPDAAYRVVDQLEAAASQLGEHPTGRPGRVPGTYEKSVPRLPYIISYALATIEGRDIVTILRVVHTAQDWPKGGWPIR